MTTLYWKAVIFILVLTYITNQTRATINISISQDVKPTIIFPSGCKCKKSDIEISKCTAFDCDCECDLTPTTCDLNCCCDDDCTREETSRFQKCHNDKRIGMDGKRDEIEMCYDSKAALETINTNYPMKVEDSIEDALHGLLCVKTINSPSRGNFFNDLGYPKPSVVFAKHDMALKKYHYNSNGDISNPIGFSSDADSFHSFSSSEDRAFQMGDLIPVFIRDANTIDSNRQDEGGFQFIFDGVFRLPSVGDNLLCNDLSVVEFGKNVEKSMCVRPINNNLEMLCKTSLRVDIFVSDLFVGSRPNKLDDNNHLQINHRIANETGIETIHFDPPTTKWDINSATCINALQKLTYNLFYNSSGYITNVSAHVKTKNVTSESNEIYQEFSLFFVHTSNAAKLENHSITLDYDPSSVTKRSGNPGYLERSPTLGGNLHFSSESSSSGYVQMDEKGFSIMDNGIDGNCDSVSTNGTAVTFGEDLMVGCIQKLTRKELEDMCTESSNPMLSRLFIAGSSEEMVIPLWLTPAYNMVGIFGNADPDDIGQWLQIDSPMNNPDFSIKNRVWLPVEGRCDGLPTRLHYKFLFTRVGNVNHPQRKIISSQLEFDYSYSLRHIVRPMQEQSYSFVTTVTWVGLKPDSETEISPPPSLLPKLTSDLFYPFEISMRKNT